MYKKKNLKSNGNLRKNRKQDIPKSGIISSTSRQVKLQTCNICYEEYNKLYNLIYLGCCRSGAVCIRCFELMFINNLHELVNHKCPFCRSPLDFKYVHHQNKHRRSYLSKWGRAYQPAIIKRVHRKLLAKCKKSVLLYLTSGKSLEYPIIVDQDYISVHQYDLVYLSYQFCSIQRLINVLLHDNA